MSESAVERPPRADTTTVRIRAANGPVARPVLCRVVSIALTRADWPVDRLEDAMLVCDAICAHARARNGRLSFSVRACAEEAELRVGDLAPEGAADMMRDARLPAVGNVLERLADSVWAQSDEDGGSELVLTLKVG